MAGIGALSSMLDQNGGDQQTGTEQQRGDEYSLLRHHDGAFRKTPNRQQTKVVSNTSMGVITAWHLRVPIDTDELTYTYVTMHIYTYMYLYMHMCTYIFVY